MANVKQFLERVTSKALEARENGDSATLNALVGDPALRNYVNNVVFMGTMTPSQFEYWHRDEYTRIQAMAEDYEQREQESERVETLAAKLERLTGMVEALLDVQTAKQRAAVEDALTEDEDDPEPVKAEAEPEPVTESEPDETDEEAEEAPRGDEPQEADETEDD